LARSIALPPYSFSEKMDLTFSLFYLVVGPLLGTYFSMGLIFYLKNRNLAYWVLITVFGIICLVQDFGIDSSTHHNRCDSIRAPTTVDDFTFGTFLSAFIGCAMFHWGAKLGFVCCFQTVNMIKISEASFRQVTQLPQQEKDVQLISLVVATFFLGSVLEQLFVYTSATACRHPNSLLVASLPLHFYITGLHQYVYALYAERRDRHLEQQQQQQLVKMGSAESIRSSLGRISSRARVSSVSVNLDQFSLSNCLELQDY